MRKWFLFHKIGSVQRVLNFTSEVCRVLILELGLEKLHAPIVLDILWSATGVRAWHRHSAHDTSNMTQCAQIGSR